MSIPVHLLLLQAEGTPASPAGPDLWRYLFVSSVMVVAVVFLGWLLRRYVAGHLRGRASTRSLRIVDALPLAGRSKLAVVQVYDRTFLLGLGEKEVSLVAELDRGTAQEVSPKAAPSGLVGAFERLRARTGEGKPRAGSAGTATVKRGATAGRLVRGLLG